jgi:hypothetical protein
MHSTTTHPAAGVHPRAPHPATTRRPQSIIARGRAVAATALVALASACGGGDAVAPWVSTRSYQATVSGDLSRTLSGVASFGVESSEGSAGFFILLGNESSDDVLGLVTMGHARPGVGTYQVVPMSDGTPPSAGAWGGFYTFLDESTGRAGVMVATSGTVRITESSAARLRGTFQLAGEGVLSDDFEAPIALTVTGTFDAGRDGSPTRLSATLSRSLTMSMRTRAVR